MKKEEIEQLLAEYVNRRSSAEKNEMVESLLANDPALKKEVDEMQALWQMMDTRVAGENNHEQFYDMLQASKQNSNTAKIIKLKPKSAWFYSSAAACVLMFFIGRLTTTPVEIIKYKTRIVRQQIEVPVQQPIAPIVSATKAKISAPAIKIQTETKAEIPSALAQQLRSVYASERIAAVMSLTGNKNIAPADLKILEIALREDTNPNVKLTIINILQPLINQQNVQRVLIRALNTQEDATTQSSLIDVLANAGSKQALPQMIALLDNKNTSAMVQDKIRDEIKRFAY